MKYKVIIGVRYYTAEFAFDNADAAISFAENAITRHVPNDDTEEIKVNIAIEKEEEEEDW